MSTEIQLNLAALALKGQRYDEAERIYSDIASNDNSTEAWLGLGVTKLYQLANGRTMDEAIFCFKRATEIDGDQRNAIQDQLMMHAQIVMLAYGKVVDAAHANSASHGVAGTSADTNTSSDTDQGVAVASLEAMGDVKGLVLSVLESCDAVFNSVTSSVDTNRPEYKAFRQFVSEHRDHVQSILDPENRKEHVASRQETSGPVAFAPSTGNTPPPFNHTLHIILSLFTAGLWLPIYSVMYWKQHE